MHGISSNRRLGTCNSRCGSCVVIMVAVMVGVLMVVVVLVVNCCRGYCCVENRSGLREGGALDSNRLQLFINDRTGERSNG